MTETEGAVATLADVAKAARVSQSTASKALNQRTDVSEATRARVAAAAKRLGYAPSPVARALGSGPTSTVGVVTTDLEGRFALPILMGIEDELGIDSVLTFLCDARGDETRERRLVDMLLRQRVDGIVLVGRQTDPRPSLGPLPVPVVYAYSESESPEDCSVTVDNAAIGRLAGEHLVALDKRHIAHISGEPNHSAAVLRLQGLTEVLASAGLELAHPPLFGLWTEGWGRAAMEVILDSGNPIDAVFCASDQLATGALDTLYERGLRVPDDIAILGVDNWEVLAENARVPLTSIDMSLKHLGRLAARRVMAAAVGRPSKGSESVQGRLVHRKSTIPSR